MLTTEVASYSILTIQLIVVCLTLVRWTTIDTAKALTSQQKNLRAKRKRLTAKRITSRQKELKRLAAKRKTSRQKEKDFLSKFLRYREAILILIFCLPWGSGYSFCREVILFAVGFFFLPWQLWATVPLKFCSRRFLILQHVGIHEN